MSPSWIRSRAVKTSPRNPRGKTYQVLYRRGGRGYRIETAGTFKTQADARTRRDLVAGWLASGLDPKAELAKLKAAPVPAKKPEQWITDWLTSLHDVDPSTKTTYRHGATRAVEAIGAEKLELITVADCQLAVGVLTERYTPATVATYWPAFALLLDYAVGDPNPARDRRVKLPKQRKPIPNVPTADHLLTMLGRIAPKYVLPMIALEQTACRVETIDNLTWGIVDVKGGRIRVTEKRDKTRWVDIPRWLMRALEATCPVEDRLPERRVFAITSVGLRTAMRTACRLGGIPHYHPHDLRHRRASLWHLQGIPDAVLAERVGHERASFTKDVYVHVMPVEEIPGERLEMLIAEAVR